MKIIHYTTLEIGLTRIIQTMKLRFGPISTTNDPYEYKKRTVGFAMDTRSFIGNKNPTKQVLSYIEKAKERIKIGSFVGEPNHDWKEGRGIRKPRMWAQYGGSQAGMAFVFDKDSFVKECRKRVVDKWAVHGRKVSYAPNSRLQSNSPSMVSFNATEEINEISIAKKLFENAKKHWYKKHQDWRDEDEYRITIYTKAIQFEFINITSSLEAIVLGDKAGKTTLKMLSNYFNNQSVEICKIDYDSHFNKYNCHSLAECNR